MECKSLKTEIKPCPFCGSEEVYIYSIDGGVTYIQCTGCRANIYIYPPDEDKKKLLQKWNKRE